MSNHHDNGQTLTDRELDAVSGGLRSAAMAVGDTNDARGPKPKPRPNGSTTAI